MKGIRKFFKVTICAVLLGSLVAGCAGRVASATGSSAASPAASAEMAETTVVTTEEVSVKPVKIACGWSSIGEQELLQKQYYEEVLAPALNIDFIFSSILATDEDVIDFLENAAAQGAEGFLDMASTSNDSATIIAEKCDELGLYDASWMTNVETDSEYFCGMASADGEFMTTAFNQMLTEDLNDGAEHSMVLFSCGAQYLIPKHLYTTMGSISAFNELFDLGLTEEEIFNYSIVQERTYVDTGKEGIKICIEPGVMANMFNELISEDLKTGDYDVVVVADSFYLQMTTAIAEAEEMLGFDLKVYCNSNIVSATQAAFDTKDPYGNSSLNQCMLKTSANGIVLMALLLNGVYGNREAILDTDGNARLYNIRFMRAGSAEDYARIALIDHDGNWMFSLDDFKQMLGLYNSELGYEWLQNYINDSVGFEAVMSRLGL